MVRILVFIDEDIVEALLVILQNIRMLFKEPERQAEQVIEIHLVLLEFSPGVAQTSQSARFFPEGQWRFSMTSSRLTRIQSLAENLQEHIGLGKTLPLVSILASRRQAETSSLASAVQNEEIAPVAQQSA